MMIRPTFTKDSYELCTNGPIIISYIPDTTKIDQECTFSYQIQSGWTPLLCSTAQCFNRIICLSADAPLFACESVDIIVEGKDVDLILQRDCLIERNDRSNVVFTDFRGSLPRTGVIVLDAADLSQFGERVQAHISDQMTVFCEGRQSITIKNGLNTRIHRFGSVASVIS
ncbi:unnamed protein product [Auanema sp. JU1783]|nr:unnamed protein product [Auanema sp. JU1783]